MKQYVKIDRKVLFEICDAILEHDGYADENFCPEKDAPCFWHYWDKDFRREAAKEILAGFAAKIGHPMSDYSEQSCKYAIQLADELILQLKQE